MEREAKTDEFALDALRGRRVVLDTQGPLIYIGCLKACDEHGYWLTDADVHDRTDGHSTKEVYLSRACELEKAGARNINRRKVFVVRREVVSISALDDVVAEERPAAAAEDWLT